MIGYGKRVLVVDDDENMRSVTAIVLEEVGFTVVLACDGLQALDEMQKRRFDAVVTDYDMPSMNGLDFLARSRISWPDTPVIIISGIECDTSDGATARGAFAWVQKPFDPCSLWKILSAAVQAKSESASELTTQAVGSFDT